MVIAKTHGHRDESHQICRMLRADPLGDVALRRALEAWDLGLGTTIGKLVVVKHIRWGSQGGHDDGEDCTGSSSKEIHDFVIHLRPDWQIA